MALERFIPKSPDINIRNGQDFEVAKFGHLNTIVEYINNNTVQPAGLNGYVQFNDNNALGGDAGLFWDNVNKRLGIGTTTPTSKLVVAATSGSLDAIFTTTDATAATTIYEDNNLGKGIRISSYGSTASGTLLDGTINRAGSVVLRTNDTSYPMVFGGISNSSEQYYFGRTGFTLALNTTTNNVTIGASSGTARLFIKGSGSTSATTSLLVQNSTPATTFSVNDAGNATIGGTLTTGGDIILSGIGSSATNSAITFTVDGSSGFTKNVITSNVFNLFAKTYANSIIQTASSNGLTFTNVNNSTGITINSPSASTYSISLGVTSQLFSTDNGTFQLLTKFDGSTNTNGKPIEIKPSNGYDQFGASTNRRGGDIFLRAGSVQGTFANLALNQGNVYLNDTQGNNVIIGSTSNEQSAILQVSSTTKGFLPPRMTNAQRGLITTPSIGLIVYCTDAVEGIYVYKSTGWTFVA